MFTVAGWILFIIISVVAFLGACVFAAEMGSKAGFAFALVLILLTFMGEWWYFTSTASGMRAIKTQKSNFDLGVERCVKVYDVEGNLIQEYSGKFDVTYDNDRILFDDENGKRHIIYYPTGTVIIDEQ